MITYVTGNLFHSPAQVLVNTVNTVGVMGKGVAYEFKRIYPEMFAVYRELCEQGKFDIGDLWLYKSRNKWVLNFPTKKHWRNPSKPEYIEAGLKKFRDTYADYGIHSIAFPAVGCGNGELDFESQVKPFMEQYLADLPIDIFIYPDREDPYLPEHIDDKFREWLRSQPEALPFSEVWQDIAEVLSIKHQFSTLDRGNPFQAVISPDGNGIRVQASGTSYLIDRDILMAFWKQLRDYGFSSRKIAPGLDRQFSYIIPIFRELPYVKAVNFTDEYNRLRSSYTIGLQYVPALAEDLTSAVPTQLSLNFE